MTTMNEPGWATTVALAVTLVEAGADGDAAELLAGPLSTLDPATTGPDHLVITAAMLYARALVPDDVAWAGYAHRAARTLHGVDHPCAIEATDTLAQVLVSYDRFDEANALRRHLIQLHLDLGDIDEHLHARMDLAQQLHDAGRCGDAIRQATTAWQEWTTRHDPTDVRSTPMALHLTGMFLACGRTGEATAVIVAADLRLPAQGHPDRTAYVKHLTVDAMARVLHRPVCRGNLDRVFGVTVPGTAAADRRS